MSNLKDQLLNLTALRYEALPMLLEQMSSSVSESSNDSISLILRCHLLTEAVLEELIIFTMKPNGQAVLAGRLSYSQKLRIVSRSRLKEGESVLPEYVIASLKGLNKLRNHFSHDLGATISREEAIELFQGVVHPMPIDKDSAEVNEIVYHYSSFIFGHMLPKYESEEA